MNNGRKPLVDARNMKKYFPMGRGSVLKAVDDISFTINRGTTLGLVGESGCGKTTAGRVVVRLYEPTSGEVLFDGVNVSAMEGRVLRGFRKRAQMIFQNPYASLNPRMTVGDVVGEGIDIHSLHSGRERIDRIYEILELVGLNREHASRFPHEFSGGQMQRIGIARALAVEPEFIVCDEPISALDVSIQAQVINLLIGLQDRFNLAYLFISHDLKMVKHVSHDVAVMYLGGLVEVASSAELYEHPAHPYTKALLSAAVSPDPRAERNKEHTLLQGEVPSPINPPEHCSFEGRCPLARSVCRESRPALRLVADGHMVACHLV